MLSWWGPLLWTVSGLQAVYMWCCSDYLDAVLVTSEGCGSPVASSIVVMAGAAWTVVWRTVWWGPVVTVGGAFWGAIRLVPVASVVSLLGWCAYISGRLDPASLGLSLRSSLSQGCEVVLTATPVALLAMGWTVAGGVVIATPGAFGVGWQGILVYGGCWGGCCTQGSELCTFLSLVAHLTSGLQELALWE